MLHVTASRKKGFKPTVRTFNERKQELEEINRLEEAEAKRRKNSPYSNWYQFNRAHTKEMIWLSTTHPMANGVLLFMLDQMDEYNALMCSYQVLSEAIGVTIRTVGRAIQVLKTHGFIAVLKSGTSNVYVINDKLAWSSWGTNYQYSKFPANVLLSATENREYLEKIEKAKLKQISIKGEE